jgi:triacylglycerol lipase
MQLQLRPVVMTTLLAAVWTAVHLPAMHPVVLLHGLGRTRRAMQPLARAAERGGREVLNIGYPSRTASVAALAEWVVREIGALRGGDAPVDFITHSLGGILVRVAAANGLLAAARIGRVVMLAPPNQGSEVPEALAARPIVGPFYRRAIGPAGLELGVGPEGITQRLPAVDFEVGVIAGSRSINPLLSRFIDGPDDGKVSIARTAVPGMRDFIVVPHSHTFLMRAPAVIRQALHFLDRGEFER